MKYKPTIGLEIHVALKTKSKMFCRCPNNGEDKEPNTTVCPICLGHPGTLPVANKKAIEWTVLTGLALNCEINQYSKFDRKNYFYPDLPKGYQISQYDLPFCHNGWLKVDENRVDITRIHLEEDAGKLLHPNNKNYSLVDYNRAGTPLMELVTEPVIKTAKQAKKFAQLYQQILRYINVSNADMEKGQMRVEANISLSPNDKKLGVKVEIKNINSFKAVEQAIEYEIKRQSELLDRGEKIIQQTRGWDSVKQKTFFQRKKEQAQDYRYFPEPDLPPVRISDQNLAEIKSQLVELPQEKKQRFKEQYSFNDYDAELLVANKNLADWTEQVMSELRAWIDASHKNWEEHKNKLAKLTANWITSELFKHLKSNQQTIKDIKITAENMAELIKIIFQNEINSSSGQIVLSEMFKTGADPSDIIREKDLKQTTNEDEITEIIKKIISNNPEQTKKYKNGKENLLQFFIGQVMKETKGKANPQIAAKLLKNQLNH